MRNSNVIMGAVSGAVENARSNGGGATRASSSILAPWCLLLSLIPMSKSCLGLSLTLALLLVPFLCTSVRAQKMTASTFFNLPYGGVEQQAYGPRKAFRAPWLDNTELRTETRDFDFERQQYVLRLSPSTPGKARAQSALYNLRENRPDFEAAEIACDELRQRYEDWLDLYLVEEELKLLSSLDSILADRNLVLNRQSASLDFDWDDLLDLRKEHTELRLRQLTLRERRKNLLAPYGIQEVTLDFSHFPAVSGLINDLEIDPIPEDPEIAYELELAAREIALERAEGRQYLDFVQGQYQGPHEDQFVERFSVGVGFQLPGNGNRKLKVRELELEQQELIRKQTLDQKAEQQQMESRLETLTGLLQLYSATTKIFDEEAEELERISNNLARREGFDPLPLLSIQARKLKNQLRALDSKQDLLERYLQLREDALCSMRAGELWRK